MCSSRKRNVNKRHHAKKKRSVWMIRGMSMIGVKRSFNYSSLWVAVLFAENRLSFKAKCLRRKKEKRRTAKEIFFSGRGKGTRKINNSTWKQGWKQKQEFAIEWDLFTVAQKKRNWNQNLSALWFVDFHSARKRESSQFWWMDGESL